jgi:hypothetical protein
MIEKNLLVVYNNQDVKTGVGSGQELNARGMDDIIL